MPQDTNYDTGQDDSDGKPDSDPDSQDSSEENTALLPKSFFRNKGDLKVGDVEKVEILHLYDDEAEVKCIYSDKKEKDSESNSNDDRSGPMKESEAAMDEAMA